MYSITEKNIIYKIALTLLPGVGSINAKKLVAYAGGVNQVFESGGSFIEKVPGMNKSIANALKDPLIWQRAEKELEFMSKNDVKMLFYLDNEYPETLASCTDAPAVLYYKGNFKLKSDLVYISMVGTRRATPEGKNNINKLNDDLKTAGYNPVIVSGLAIGIDTFVHKAALRNNLVTLAVLGHGLHTIYPAENKQLANEIVENGLLISEYMSDSILDPSNFVKRNRIIAGLSVATIVVESNIKGGALISADFAQSYNRDVFAFPGRVTDKASQGCNYLIKTNKAALIESLTDLEYQLGWLRTNHKKPVQSKLFAEVTDEEKIILELLEKEGKMNIDLIALHTGVPVSKISVMLLNLEFKGVVMSLPGKVYASTR